MKHPLKQVTVRGLDPQLEEVIRRLAEQEGISLNKAALRLLKKGAGQSERPSPAVIGNALDHLFGTWSEKEAREFNSSIRSSEQIDRQFWK